MAEIGFGAGTAYGIHRFVQKNNYYIKSITNKLITLTAADIAGKYISDYWLVDLGQYYHKYIIYII